MQKQTFFKYDPPLTDKQFGVAEFGILIEEIAVDKYDTAKTIVINFERHPVWNQDKQGVLDTLDAQKVAWDERAVEEKKEIDKQITEVTALN